MKQFIFILFKEVRRKIIGLHKKLICALSLWMVRENFKANYCCWHFGQLEKKIIKSKR